MKGAIALSDVYDLMDSSYRPAASGMVEVEAYFVTRNLDPSHISAKSYVVYTGPKTCVAGKRDGGSMRGLLHYDLQDLAVMLGTGMFVGSTSAVIWNAVSSVSAPQSLVISASLIGLAAGRLLSEKGKRRANGR